MPHEDSTSGQLEALGFTDRFRALFAPYADEGLVPARVVRADKGFLAIATVEEVAHAKVATKLMKTAEDADAMPAVGDWVAVRADAELEVPLVEAVLPRSSAFVRGDPGRASVAQVLAANVDTVLIVHPLDREPNVRRIERELALAWDSGATPAIVLTKADLAEDIEAALEAVGRVALGVDVHATSIVDGRGIEALHAYARDGATVAFIGPSGAGKSSLVNALVGEDVRATREVRATDARGRHTTVTRELVPLPGGGVLLDTPGLRAVAMWDAEEGLSRVFEDVEAYASECRFRDCRHELEPGCAVRAAVEDGELPAERLESYLKLRAESERASAAADVRAKLAEKREHKTLAKTIKRYYKDQKGG